MIDDDNCIECGGPSTVGVIGLRDGQVYNDHYCDKHYNSFKFSEESPKPKKKMKSKDSTFLMKKGLKVIEKNNGLQLVVSSGKTVADFWPSSGKFIFRSTNKKGQSLDNLIFEFGL